MTIDTVTLTATPEQVAFIRNSLLYEIMEAASVLYEEAQKAAENRDGVSGEDARSTFGIVADIARALDVVGWDVRGDIDVLHGDARAPETEATFRLSTARRPGALDCQPE